MKKHDNNMIIRKIKKGHAWLSILSGLIVIAISALTLAFIVTMLTYYFIHTKLAVEYSSVSLMSAIYEKSLGEENGDIAGYLDESGRIYFVRDDEGSTLFGEDDPDCTNVWNYAQIFNTGETIRLYRDADYQFFSVGADGSINIEIIDLINTIKEEKKAGDQSEILYLPETDKADDLYENAPLDYLFFGPIADMYIRFPLWMGIELPEGGAFIAKCYLSVKMTDISVLGTALFMLGILLLIIFTMFIVNIIGNIRKQRKIFNMVFFDVVTEGHNRMWALYRGGKLVKNRMPGSRQYAAVDLFFVNYNTFCVCHSVAEGEELLRKMYRSLGKMLNRGEIRAVGSPGEFLLLLRYDDYDRLTGRLNAIISQLEKTDTDHTFYFHAGVSVISSSKGENERKLRHADIEQEFSNALTARHTLGESSGSATAFFDLKLVEERRWRDKVEEHSRQALVNSEFLVYYQPKYDPVTCELKGAEALIRWQSPELGFVSPGKFIPIFESNGFITEIDHYMLSHVAADQKRWLDMGKKCVPVSVNVSRAHFIESDLAEQIRDIVDAAGAPRDLIEIELTESAFFDDKNALIGTIGRLKEYGFSVSMDDFGSGFSSLNSLKDMPLDVLKIDAEFFRGDNAGERGQIVVSETIKLARSLNMKTVAEGVEEKEQVDFLAGQGCDMIQGYYFAKPMPAGEYENKMGEPAAQDISESIPSM